MTWSKSNVYSKTLIESSIPLTFELAKKWMDDMMSLSESG